MTDEHYEVLRLLKIDSVDKRLNKFWNSAKEYTTMFSSWSEIATPLGWLRNGGFISTDKYNNLNIEKKGHNAYDVYLKYQQKEQHKTDIEYQKLQLEIQTLTDTVSNYNTTEWRAKWGFRIAIITLIVTIVLEALKWIYKK